MTSNEPLLNIAEAAQRLGVHKNTLRKWADDGRIAHVRLPSGYRRFRSSELERVKQEMEQGVVEDASSVKTAA